MRLIDADELINQGYEIVVDGWQYDTCNKSIDIDTIPTAYDIDKVVKKLEKAKHTICLSDDDLEYYQNGIDEAIEIVKQGGVSDDVCEPSADKVKVTSLEVIVTGSKRKPYYEIKYKEVGVDHYNIGYSSYNLDFVLDWKEKCFELIKVVE